MTDDLYQQLAARERDRRRNAVNAAANTGAFAKFISVGQGPFEFEEMVDFAVAFSEEPFMSYGCGIDVDDLCDLLGLDPDDDVPPFPLCSGFVTNWTMDANNFYVGAHVGVRVHFPLDLPTDTPVAADVAVQVTHYYRFEGMALKGI